MDKYSKKLRKLDILQDAKRLSIKKSENYSELDRKLKRKIVKGY